MEGSAAEGKALAGQVNEANAVSTEGDTRVPLIVGHRPDVEGLRAVAVLAVLLYHAGVPGLDGGYVGVDVFFVVSGYLMTALLVSERWRNDRISFSSFYARRARRLLPASVTVLLATLVASWFVLPPLAFERAATDAAAAGGYVVNLRFAAESTDYLGSEVGSSPVLHYWSLAVEEQFYFVWPLLLAVSLGRSARRRGPVIVLSLLVASSFTLSVVWTSTIQPWAFFSLPTRAWEFAVGGLAAFWAPRRRTWRSAAAGWVGLLTVIVAVAAFDDAITFPGPMAMIPVVGTAMVLAAGGRGPAVLLEPRPMQWIGRHSYGLYLWHWPPLVLLPVALGRELRLVEALAVLVATILVAAVALRLVEDPIRFARPLASAEWRSAVLGVGLTLLAVVVPMWARATIDTVGSGEAVSIERTLLEASPETVPSESSTSEPRPVRFVLDDPVGPTPAPSNLVPSLEDVGDDVPGDLYEVGCHADQLATTPGLPCTYGTATSDTTIVLFRDSHMAQWFPMFEEAAAALDIRIVSITKSGCPSATKSVYNDQFDRPYTECDEWRDAAFAAISALRPSLVVLANYPSQDGPGPIRATIDRLLASDFDVLVIGPTPRPSSRVPDCVSASLGDTRPCDIDRASRVSSEQISWEQAAADEVGVAYLDVTDWFCGPTVCPAVIGEYLVYRDKSHVTTTYVSWLAPWFRSAWYDLGLPVGSSAS